MQEMSRIMSIETIVVAKGEHAAANLGSETVILDTRRGVYYSVDAVGSRIWALLQKPILVGDIRDQLVEQYNVETDVCEEGVIDFLEKLAANELVTLE
jgi:hypothetical protein